MKTDAYY